jgi:iron complex outermembrane receptor protein
LPLARADGSFHSGLFDPLLFDRIEVCRGTLHTALAPAVLGGVLNAMPANRATPGVSLRAEAGDFGRSRLQLAVAGPGVGLNASVIRARGWREHSRQDRRAFQGGRTHEIGGPGQIEFSVYLAEADYEVPGPLTLAEASTRPRAVSATVRRDQPRRDAALVRLAAQWRNTSREGSLAAGLGWLRLRDDFIQLQANGATESVSEDFTAHATASRWRRAVGADHHVFARATFSAGGNRIDRHVNDRSIRGARFAALDTWAHTLAVSFEDLIRIRPQLGAGIGATAVHARRAIADRFSQPGTPATVARAFSVADFSPRAGLTWQAGRSFSVRGGVSQGIEPPTFDDLLVMQGTHPNLSLRSRELRAQRATTVEAGAQGQHRALAWSVTFYRAAWRDEILRLADAAGLPRGAVNAGPTRHQGLEAALRWRILTGPQSLSLAINSTVGRHVFVGDALYGRNRLAGSPPQVGAAELTYAHPAGWFGALESTWVAGRTAVDHAGRLTYGGHTLAHARVGWRGRRRTVFAAVRNLLDRSQLASTAGVLDLARAPAATAIFLPGSGRAITVGFEWKR